MACERSRCSEGTVVVQAGDTLSSLSLALHVDLPQLVATNTHVDSDVDRALRTGGHIRLPCRFVEVPAGDTLCAAARRHGTDPATLRELNGLIASDSLLRAGQQLRVPRTLPRGCASTTRGGPRVRCGDRLVVVREGDTLWDLARVLRVPVDHLVAVSGGSTGLRPGQVLAVSRDSYLRRCEGGLLPAAAAQRFFGGFRFTKNLDELQKATPHMRHLLKAMRFVETSNRMPAPVGDGGKSIGPLQISHEYHVDAWSDSHGADRATHYQHCNDVDYAEATSLRYMRRWVPWALQFGDVETLARAHNGGPGWSRAPKTSNYWRKISSAMHPYTFYDQPQFRSLSEPREQARSAGAAAPPPVLVPMVERMPLQALLSRAAQLPGVRGCLHHLGRHAVDNPMTRLWTGGRVILDVD